MTGLEQIKTAVAAALAAGGLNAVTEYQEERLRRYSAPVAVVGLAKAEVKDPGVCRYFGRETDENGNPRERYGRELTASLSLDVYAPKESGASGTEDAVETAAELLMRGLPAGLKPTGLLWEKVAWDTQSEMFLRRGVLECRALMVASAAEEDGELFLDFILKGVVSV